MVLMHHIANSSSDESVETNFVKFVELDLVLCQFVYMCWGATGGLPVPSMPSRLSIGLSMGALRGLSGDSSMAGSERASCETPPDHER